MRDAIGGSAPLDRNALVAWYVRNRERSAALFDLLATEAYYAQPIALRHPIVFYEGHLPAFSFNTPVKKGLGRPSIDARLETLFARGIDPSATTAASAAEPSVWPARSVVQQFASDADRQVIDALAHADIERPNHPLLNRAEAAFSILEHEAMHQETLLYMWHRLPFVQKRPPPDYSPFVGADGPANELIQVEPGQATLGIKATDLPFSWDNERPAFRVQVEGFAIERHNVTNARFLEFVEAGGYSDARWWTSEGWQWINEEGIRHPLFWERHDDRWFWRGMFELVPLPLGWPAYVSQTEACAFARWAGRRLPTEAEFQRAAFGTPEGVERRYPWGHAEPTPAQGVFDFASWDPQPAGSHPGGRSAWG